MKLIFEHFLIINNDILNTNFLLNVHKNTHYEKVQSQNLSKSRMVP